MVAGQPNEIQEAQKQAQPPLEPSAPLPLQKASQATAVVVGLAGQGQRQGHGQVHGSSPERQTQSSTTPAGASASTGGHDQVKENGSALVQQQAHAVPQSKPQQQAQPETQTQQAQQQTHQPQQQPPPPKPQSQAQQQPQTISPEPPPLLLQQQQQAMNAAGSSQQQQPQLMVQMGQPQQLTSSQQLQSQPHAQTLAQSQAKVQAQVQTQQTQLQTQQAQQQAQQQLQQQRILQQQSQGLAQNQSASNLYPPGYILYSSAESALTNIFQQKVIQSTPSYSNIQSSSQVLGIASAGPTNAAAPYMVTSQQQQQQHQQQPQQQHHKHQLQQQQLTQQQMQIQQQRQPQLQPQPQTQTMFLNQQQKIQIPYVPINPNLKTQAQLQPQPQQQKVASQQVIQNQKMNSFIQPIQVHGSTSVVASAVLTTAAAAGTGTSAGTGERGTANLKQPNLLPSYTLVQPTGIHTIDPNSKNPTAPIDPLKDTTAALMSDSIGVKVDGAAQDGMEYTEQVQALQLRAQIDAYRELLRSDVLLPYSQVTAAASGALPIHQNPAIGVGWEYQQQFASSSLAPTNSTEISSKARAPGQAHAQFQTQGNNMANYTKLIALREERIRDRIRKRLTELQRLPIDVPEYLVTKAAIEQKQIALVDLQRKVRMDVVSEMKRLLSPTNIADFENRSNLLRREPKNVLQGVGSVMNKNLKRQIGKYKNEQEERRRMRQRAFLSSLMEHIRDFKDYHMGARGQTKKATAHIERYHRDKQREEERRKKRAQYERLKALRENDEEQYMKLLESTKSERLIQLIRQTDEYLQQIGAKVIDLKRQEGEAEKPNAESDLHEDGVDSWEAIKNRRKNYYALAHSKHEDVKQPPSLVGGTLKQYQLEGLQWLVSLYNNNMNGILADEMGLGKTIQTISLLTYLVDFKQVYGPFLVIVPLSTLSNWMRELEKWAPSLVTVVYKGDPITRKNIQIKEMAGTNYNVLLTTYEFIVKDKSVLGRIKWKYIIIDEGHRMKNTDCKLALTLGSKYSSKNRILLTGTPLQNNLTELWALLNFLLPTIFSSSDSFENWFSLPFQQLAVSESTELTQEETLLVINRLHQVLRPFLLRRLKTDVETQLPDKVERVVRCELSVWQKTLYRQVKAKLAFSTGEDSGKRTFNNIVMQMKKICNHPYLFYDFDDLSMLPRDFLIRSSGKFFLLNNITRKLEASGHRILVFSQMTHVLDYLESLFELIGYEYLRLDGTTKSDDRQLMLEKFNKEDSPYFCFLLSTRAGGLGLNLQTADTVIIFDSDWNPQMDLQAQDRAHRIGQTNEVRVFRFVTAGTIEEQILDRANSKLQMDAQIIQAGQFNNKSSDQDRRDMLKRLLSHKADEEMESDLVDNETLNQWLARSEEEFELFQQMDRDREATEDESIDKNIQLLRDENDLPEWVLAPEREAKEEETNRVIEFEQHGRGQRKRKQANYTDILTERDWIRVFEHGIDPDELAQQKLEQKEMNKKEEDEGSSVVYAGSSDGKGTRRRRISLPNPKDSGLDSTNTDDVSLTGRKARSKRKKSNVESIPEALDERRHSRRRTTKTMSFAEDSSDADNDNVSTDYDGTNRTNGRSEYVKIEKEEAKTVVVTPSKHASTDIDISTGKAVDGSAAGDTGGDASVVVDKAPGKDSVRKRGRGRPRKYPR